VKALSIRQPWAWAILHAGKRLENRDWKGCAYRGPILIHASKGVGTLEEFGSAVDDVLDRVPDEDEAAFLAMFDEARGRVRPGRIERGGIVGRARIDGVIASARDLDTYGEPRAQFWREEQHLWYAGGFALVLADVEALPFVPWKGELGLFEVPDDYATRTP
jgi:hypothetical protein